jgi:outer membrane protein OmpA-like peptidoglycan-associated protein
MGAILSIFLLISTAQAPVLYSSPNALFPASQGYVLCQNCPAPSRRQPLRRRQLISPALLRKASVQKLRPPVVLPSLKPAVAAQPVKGRQTVLFDFNSYVLKPAEKSRLERLNKKNVIDVIGYTDDIGTKEYNDGLALKRASSVVSYLGISVPFEGKGKCCYVSTIDNSLNRRVDIDIKAKRRLQNEKERQ